MNWIYRFSLFLLLFSCTPEEPDQFLATGISYEVSFGKAKFQADNKQFQKLNFERASDPICNQANLEIRGIKRTGDRLLLTVLKKATCQGNYRLVWDGFTQESSPERVQFFLFPEFNSCTQTDEMVLETIEIDLKKAFYSLDPKVVDRMILYIREYCNFVDYLCEGNCEWIKN
ncbi:hypothetical protein DFQ04_1288 [Algoriphagus boseongensis]|uniref:Uncharacterized protein n=1 Tax=Algoriphagus boseongensis TaxID=1442587 RepID=A0A4V6PW67_9BACT|nr:hypothetical protein [Algoriphagus boseongensis]TDQ19467.1 hypothetical protein DFQ04_1288 [Algoriphagus boseongensis]